MELDRKITLMKEVVAENASIVETLANSIDDQKYASGDATVIEQVKQRMQFVDSTMVSLGFNPIYAHVLSKVQK